VGEATAVQEPRRRTQVASSSYTVCVMGWGWGLHATADQESHVAKCVHTCLLTYVTQGRGFAPEFGQMSLARSRRRANEMPGVHGEGYTGPFIIVAIGDNRN
jgi:hypothetical protein